MSEEAQDLVQAQEQETSVEPAPTVGQRLRAAREAANLTTNDVALSLKFSPRQVELLEADDYSALPGNTVVRGFTRSYARLLKLDADELLHLLDGRTPTQPADVRPPENMGTASDAHGERQISPLVSITIVVALAAVILSAWHFFGPDTKTAEVKKNAIEPEAPVVEVQRDSTESGAGTTMAGSATAEPAESPAASSGPSALIFSFEDRSWVEVSDGTKQMLHTGENLAGTRLNLDGKPPFDIVVGNATKVKLIYGGREIDLVPHTRADVARFRLE